MSPSKLRVKINQRMDMLQDMMEQNIHLKDAEAVTLMIQSVSKFWSVLDEGDKDYIHCAQDAVENGKEWNV